MTNTSNHNESTSTGGSTVGREIVITSPYLGPLHDKPHGPHL